MSTEEPRDDGASTAEEPVRRRRPVVWVVGAAVVLLAVVVAIALLVAGDDDDQTGAASDVEDVDDGTADDGDGPAGPVVSLSGPGDLTSDEFEAALNWEIRWEAQEGEPFQVEVFDGDGQSRGVVVDSDGGGGSTFVSEDGDFYLEVRGAGDWSVEVYDRGA